MKKALTWENFKSDLIKHGLQMPCIDQCTSECFYDDMFEVQIRVLYIDSEIDESDWIDIGASFWFNEFVHLCLKNLDAYNGVYNDLSDMSDYLFSDESFINEFEYDFKENLEWPGYIYESGE